MVLDKDVLEWLDKVKKESRNSTEFVEYDSCAGAYNDSYRATLYDFYEYDNKKRKETLCKVVIFTYCGSVVDYYFREVDDE